jgi:Domain of unknown function (DUF5916)/Carbohydrate family 9 binding domain-like
MTASLRTLSLTAFLFVLAVPDGEAQSINGSRKQILAHNANGSAPNIDGRLDDAIWQTATFTSDFLQKEPSEGAQPSDRTEVAIAYDEGSLYVGVRLFTSDPSKLDMTLDRRDVQGRSEQFIVTLDSYHDRRTAYGFGVTASGVRFDRYNYEDVEYARDYSFNPVWDAHTSRDDKSWTVEMRIPFSQLRFSRAEEVIMGINFNRWIPEKNEDIYWIYVPRNETGWASRFGDLTGIKGVAPSRRIELLPYGVSNASVVDGDFDGNPFTDGKETDFSGGADLKMGLGPNLTLDATFNPDFGQVELDPAQINLSAFESFFSDRRPFFTEGYQLVSGPNGGSYSYSRRIGQAPGGPTPGSWTYVDYPASTSILGAAKLTGRLSTGTSLGVMAAATDREWARVENLFGIDTVVNGIDTTIDTTVAARDRIEVQAPTLYTIARVVQEFGEENSTVGAMFTTVVRDIDSTRPLHSRQRDKAFAGGVDWSWRFSGGKYLFSGLLGGSYVTGSESAIARTQLASSRYFQRPDADYVTYDSTLTSLSGYRSYLSLRKQSAEHWLWGIEGGMRSPGFEVNDAGFLGQVDRVSAHGDITYRENQPSTWYRSCSVNSNFNGSWNYGGSRQYSEIGSEFDIQWSNYWNSSFSVTHQIGGQDDKATRGGPSMEQWSGLSIHANLSNNFTSKVTWNVGTLYAIDNVDGWIYGVDASIGSRIGNKFKFSIGGGYYAELNTRLYVATISDQVRGSIDSTRYIFSHIDRTTLSMEIRANYYFTPDVSLEIYAEPFAASGRNDRFGELVAPRGIDLRYYDNESGLTMTTDFNGTATVDDNGEIFSFGYHDFGERSFRSNAVLRWEFSPGSTLYFVWQRNLGESREKGSHVKPKSLFDSFGADGQDFVALKIAWWIPLS